MGRGGFWPAISNRFIGTRCRIHIAKWPLVQTDCSKPVRPCLLHPSLSLSLLFFSFRLHHGYDDTRVGSVVCFSRPTTYFSRQRGERKKKNEKGKRGKDRKSEILVAFHVQQEEEQLQRERETKGEGKGRKSELLVRVNNKNNYNNRETLSIEDSYRVKPILETSLSSIRLWNDESFSLSLSRWHLARCLCSGKLRERNCVSREYCKLPYIPIIVIETLDPCTYTRQFRLVPFVSVIDPYTIYIIAFLRNNFFFTPSIYLFCLFICSIEFEFGGKNRLLSIHLSLGASLDESSSAGGVKTSDDCISCAKTVICNKASRHCSESPRYPIDKIVRRYRRFVACSFWHRNYRTHGRETLRAAFVQYRAYIIVLSFS